MPTVNFGDLKNMQTDMETLDAAGCSGSSKDRRKSKPASSPPTSPTPSPDAQGAEGGGAAESRLTPADVLLTLLQSHLSELRQAGVGIKLYRMAEGTQVALTGVSVCPVHQILHSGLKCHQCA